MLVDTLLQHEVEGRVDRLVEEAEGLENKRAESVEELAIKVAEEVAEQLQGLLSTIVAQVGDHINNQGINGSRNDNATNGNIQEVIGMVEKMKAVQDISGCGDNQKVKYSAGSLIGRALTWWNSEVRTRGREDVVGMTWENFKALMKEEYCLSNKMQRLEAEFWSHSMVGAGHAVYTDRFHKLARLDGGNNWAPMIQNDILKAGVLTDEAVRNGSLKRTGERRGDGGESSKEGNVKGD
ncbi:reverse transcriptase domain-containing protein [Tanacetum coccineum]